ncbi:hypothetical protein B0T22DRAFT_283689 [Podospora appendiculata]|uniref:Uncharacterized protein n=1 Tax=Podospora appendiculata TaxID=314037 RepID=A0AAE0X1A0_9PEZI|nr:hypothetical protein B0T22DRAFT_283689 [Podospora appendiculata]
MSHTMPPPPPLLLSKRVTAFLHANLSSHIRMAALTTPAGKLLAHASTLPASVLRRQCGVAASLWALYASSAESSNSSAFGDAAESSLPATGSGSRSSSSNGYDHRSTKSRKSSSRGGGESAPAVTVQLDSGVVFVIRRLRCGMLFVCMGGNIHSVNNNTPSSGDAKSPNRATPTPTLPTASASAHHTENGSPSTPAGETTTPQPASSSSGFTHQHIQTPSAATTTTTAAAATPPLGSPSEAASILSAANTIGAATIASQSSSVATAGGSLSAAGVLAMRRQVEELARWLDEQLRTLWVPEEGIGIAGPVEVR